MLESPRELAHGVTMSPRCLQLPTVTIMAAAADEVPEYAPELTEEEQELVQGLQDCMDRARQRANKHWPPDVAQEMLQALMNKAKVGSCLAWTAGGCSTAGVVPVGGTTCTGLLGNGKVSSWHICAIQGCGTAWAMPDRHSLSTGLQILPQAMLQELMAKVKIRSCVVCLFVGCARLNAGTCITLARLHLRLHETCSKLSWTMSRVEASRARIAIKNCQLALERENLLLIILMPAKMCLPSDPPCSLLDCALPLLQSGNLACSRGLLSLQLPRCLPQQEIVGSSFATPAHTCQASETQC